MSYYPLPPLHYQFPKSNILFQYIFFTFHFLALKISLELPWFPHILKFTPTFLLSRRGNKRKPSLSRLEYKLRKNKFSSQLSYRFSRSSSH